MLERYEEELGNPLQIQIVKNFVNTVFRICLRQSLILRDVAFDRLPTDTNSAGYLPLTQTINAMVMENLFFLVHVYHVLTDYTITALF